MKSQIVYIVTSGEYSDYGINAVFSTEEKAKEYIAQFNDKGTYPRPYFINEYIIDDTSKMKGKPYKVEMLKNGNVVIVEHKDDVIDDDDIWAYEGKLHWHGYANDEQHAIKIANEVRIQLIANNEL